MEKDNPIDFNRALTIGEVSKRSGVAISALHFYESKGLIKSSRNQGNQRRFPSIVLRYIAIIKVAQSTGISLKEIKQALDQFPPDSQLTAEQWLTFSLQLQDILNQRIKKLIRLRDNLGNCIGCGCLSLTECPLRNPNDVLGQDGAGPRILEKD
ncbi:redox-sensitive transcriptional activator SoxR [Xenorhabdus griffiniae]|uniref:Redox-sensitive transcriptional activator SoxR n=1 Tax=Xenorhabdus griffiniae TaxID=351672 RepID=A0ABY9XIH9_9GAMM|nr:redox-sensitive transcriptional activator SoxR [Xenorhabdus griffiniae]MBD1228443.1 redox-sensitive transcriptional activator SoxR [Xenorhabdus griffiniae]MBE8587905.1 redox-sensitive transcriptional activator SoxR [Xenorhabdus griffiniae]WMV72608.1 redox-sensitive transcriptional activator SoxR [Xenorhabdus griffiniae]WNH02287.1 redox-sensitive transcriptional activator SoxR [Xenorhabdus griffiniae]